MMMYEVIRLFTDLQDGRHRYEVGDTYPREGYTPTDERIAELAGNSNKQHTPLIKAVETVAEVDESEAEETTEPPEPRRKGRKRAGD